MTTSTTTPASNPGMASHTLAIDGMSGEECIKKVLAAIKAVPNVRSTNVSVGAATITAGAAGCVSTCEAIGRAGFTSRESNKGAPAHAPAKSNPNPATSANTNAPATSNTNAPANSNANTRATSNAPANTPANAYSGDAAMRAGVPANTHDPVKPGADKSSYNNVTRSGDAACTSPTMESKPDATKPDATKANADCCTDAGKTDACVKPEAAKA